MLQVFEHLGGPVLGLGGGEQLRGVVDELGCGTGRTRTPGGVRMLLRKDMLVLTPRMRISAMARSILRAVPSSCRRW